MVIWDNLGAHHRAGVEVAVRDAGCEVWFLPPYSPDLNPIEECFSKLKAWLRLCRARSVEALVDAIGVGFERVSCSDVLGWFGHAGVVV